MKISGYIRFRPLATVLVTVALVACGPDNPETQLKEAATEVEKAEHSVEAAREDVQAAQEDVQSLQQEVDKAQEQLADEREQLASKQGELAAEQNELDSTASDTAIFRLVQGRLLDDSSLSAAAIGVEVINGEVTLRGDVESQAQKETAGLIASDTPGVGKVVNLVNVTGLSESGESFE